MFIKLIYFNENEFLFISLPIVSYRSGLSLILSFIIPKANHNTRFSTENIKKRS